MLFRSKIPNSQVDLIDISEKALEVSKKNMKNLKIEANLIKNDMLTNIHKKYDYLKVYFF